MLLLDKKKKIFLVLTNHRYLTKETTKSKRLAEELLIHFPKD